MRVKDIYITTPTTKTTTTNLIAALKDTEEKPKQKHVYIPRGLITDCESWELTYFLDDYS